LETKNSKPLDTKLAGIKCEKLDVALKGVKSLGDMCDRLSRRMDAFEGSAEELAQRVDRQRNG
jgi:hypothetical protein